jgi:NDP-mannose synthase
MMTTNQETNAKPQSVRAILLAGGRGTRLAPYTTVLPKPLMPVGDMPILEILIRQLGQKGISGVTIAVGHLASLIMAYFGDGAKFGVPIEYSIEEHPLGTAGPIGLIAGLTETFLVMNGDLLTDLDFRQMVQFHQESRATATIGLFERDIQIDLGVIETDESHLVTNYIEKPSYHYRASMGIYVFEPSVLRHIPAGQRFDLPDLIRALIEKKERVAGYVHTGYWLDIGRPDDYQRAQNDFQTIRNRLLG